MNININCGEIKYLEIRSKMEKISKVENYLQIDTYNCSKIILDQQMKSDLEDFSNFIMTYTCNETYFEYVKKYKEKYGNQAVKLTDVLDENNGLGYPKSDSKNTVKNTEKMLLVLLNQLMTNDSNVIDLSKGVLKQNLEKICILHLNYLFLF